MADKVIKFRSSHAKYSTDCGSTKIRFAKFHYSTSDEKIIEFLREKAKNNPGVIKELLPDKKVKVVMVENDQTVEEALEKSLEAEKASKPQAKSASQETDNKAEESTGKTKVKK